MPLLCIPQENLSWYSVLNIFHKVGLVILSADYMAILCTEICVILYQDCWSYMKVKQGSSVLRHGVYWFIINS